MKYKTVRIYPIKNEWKSFITVDVKERVDTKSIPHSMGFYHYPETISDEDAFNSLKDCLIKAHEEEITRLNKSLKRLRKLEFSI